jgi:uncharacterized protein (TIGR02145 family)
MIMKRILVMVASAALVLGLAGCSDLNDRVDQLESDVQELQDGLKTLKAAVDAKLTVTGVTPTENGSKVTFSDGSSIDITNGKDGKNGDTLIGSISVENGYAYITLAEGTSFYFPVYSPVGAVKSIVFIPEYSDGKGTIDKNGLADFHFHVYPESALKGLKEAYDKQELTLLVTTTEIKTREGEEEEVIAPVIKFEESAGMFTIEGLSFKEDEGTEIAVSIGFEDQFTAVSSEFIPMVWEGYVELAGVRYSTREMKDGKVWMTENLRYIPEGYTPCDDVNNVTAGVYYPLTLNTAEDGMVFSQNTYIIEEQGYLYQSEVALGLKVGDIQDEEKAKSLEGVQGICPEGWHIPTADDIMGLVGKSVTPYVTNEDAPYYDKAKKNATLELLNADGFNFHPYGAVTIANMSTKKATLMGYLKTNPGNISSGYYCGSTTTGPTKDQSSGNITGYQFLALMPMANLGTANGAKLSHRIAASVRCVKD